MKRYDNLIISDDDDLAEIQKEHKGAIDVCKKSGSILNLGFFSIFKVLHNAKRETAEEVAQFYNHSDYPPVIVETKRKKRFIII